ncbi:MAG: hypothetical protein HQK64_06450 [Desulfamplus sp.]|nr:hypothetical protein [Desulfamplus sp.]MBF0242108.1 hypothetical protein [Desulfamplus sp.]
MNINSYSGYSNSILNPYSASISSTSNVQSLNETSSPTSTSQDALRQVLNTSQSPQQSSTIGSDFNVNISQEARAASLAAEQSQIEPMATSEAVNSDVGQTTLSTEADQAQQFLQSIETQQTQQTQQQQQDMQEQQSQQIQQSQQAQQIQSQFYQSPYGQIPLSRSSSIDMTV